MIPGVLDCILVGHSLVDIPVAVHHNRMQVDQLGSRRLGSLAKDTLRERQPVAGMVAGMEAVAGRPCCFLETELVVLVVLSLVLENAGVSLFQPSRNTQ